MSTTIKQDEAVPDSYPSAPSGLSTAAAALDADMIWQRIESYIAYRWTSRAVTWVVEGDGEWLPPLAPVTVSAVDIWESDAWAAVTLSPSPLGGYVLLDATYRFTATVDSGTVPAAVNEAFRRLAEYLAAKNRKPGVSRYSMNLGDLSESYDTSLTWKSKAMQYSGAADLLRAYRKAN